MTFRKEAIYCTPQVHFVLSHAALGDMIASLPAIAYARQNTAQKQLFTVWVPEYQVPLVQHLLAGLHNLRVLPLHEFDPKAPGDKAKGYGPEWQTEGMAVVNYFWEGQATRNKCPLVDYSYLCLLDRLPMNDSERNYPHKAPLGVRKFDNYIAIATESTSENKVLKRHVYEKLIPWIHERGYTPVIIGRRSTSVRVLGEDKPLVVINDFDNVDPKIKALCADLRDTTTLMEARDLCGYAQAVVGLDTGLLHLAGTTNTKIVYGVTHMDPNHRLITRFDHPGWNTIYVRPRDLACSGCQSNMQLMFHHDFRKCIYEDNLCTDRLHADDFITALKSLDL